jgi:hypothetical protein
MSNSELVPASSALARTHEDYSGMTMAVAPGEARRRLGELQAFVREVMVRGEDYGQIPGTEKDTLYQAGAQKLAELYGLSQRFIVVEAVKDWERGFFYFEYRCELHSRRDGGFVGEGMGSCNSRETKFAGRWTAATDVPSGMNLANLPRKPGMSWVFKDRVPAGINLKDLPTQTRKSKRNGSDYLVYGIEAELFFVPNPEVYSLVNTFQKMAAKRAYVMAVIAATRSAGIFNPDHDAEDPPPARGSKAKVSPPPAVDAADIAESDPAQDATVAKRAAAFVNQIDAAKDKTELGVVLKAIAKSGLPEEYLTGLRECAEQAKTRLTKHDPPAKAASPTPEPQEPKEDAGELSPEAQARFEASEKH